MVVAEEEYQAADAVAADAVSADAIPSDAANSSSSRLRRRSSVAPRDRVKWNSGAT